MKVLGLACVAAVAVCTLAIPALAQAPVIRVLPRPARVEAVACAPSDESAIPHTVAASFDAGARDELNERWRALGIGQLRVSDAQPEIAVVRDTKLAPQSYRLTIARGRATIESSDGDGSFNAAMTLAQLPVRGTGGWTIPCVRIEDGPALRWRILSDDVSRGPLPTMSYFKERIRTIAAFKMNGYSPYMENAFVSPSDPLPAPLDGVTPDQLRELNAYAARFHVALIPDQQTFAHMHNMLRLERYAQAAELPHGFLLSPNVPLSSEYVARTIAQELAAVPHPPFFHIGSDETSTLGLGQTQAYVKQHGLTQTYADHIVAMNRLIAPSGARLMLWGDAIDNDPSVLSLLPRTAVIVNWRYGVETTYRPSIDRIAAAGFEQMVSPGAGNWNEIFPAIDTAIANERGFIADGRDAHVLGVFETVWHDDGETLYEATWYPVLYAACAAWQSDDLDPRQFAADFSNAFFGSDRDYAKDVAALGEIRELLDAAPYDRTNALFWSTPFDPAVEARMKHVDLARVRTLAESVEQDLYAARPPLHENAAFVMFLAARRYDTLARAFQIYSEVRTMYAEAVSHASEKDGPALRDLFWCRYWMWELRDAYEDLAPLYARAWRYESRDGGLASNLERYHLAAGRAIGIADAFYRATYEGYVRTHTLPPIDTIVGEP